MGGGLVGGRLRWICGLPGPTAWSRTSPSATLVPQISTQRKVNIYNILQEIIQQEGELEERCVQRLVAIASKEMRDMLEVADVLPPPAWPPPQGAGLWWARRGRPEALVRLSHGNNSRLRGPKGPQQGWSR